MGVAMEMIKHTIPLDGYVVAYFDPITMSDVYGGSPLLDMDSSACGLKFEVQLWLDKTCCGYDWEFGTLGGEYCIWFPKQEHLTLFLLRWA